MIEPPDLLRFDGDWSGYVDRVYRSFVESFVEARIRFKGDRVLAQRQPETLGKGFSFWHVVSESPGRGHTGEDERIPDLRRCERIQWIAWAIEAASDDAEGFTWWESRRKSNVHVVIWAEPWDYVVVLARRRDYYLLKTAFCELKPHRRKAFERERAAYWQAQKS